MSEAAESPGAHDGSPKDGGGMGSHENSQSTYLALFYDLVFVAATLIFSKGVEHVHPESGAFWIIAVFAASWWIWYSTTLLAHRLLLSDLTHRMLLLFQMLLIVLLAMEARVSVERDAAYLGVEFGLLLLSVSVMYWRARNGDGPGASASGRLAAVTVAAASCFFVGVLFGEPARLVFFLLGLAISVVGTLVFWHGRVPFSAGDEQHYNERMAAFTLIVCGEAFIENALAVSAATISSIDIGSLVFEFVLVFALFSAYFEDIPAAGINPRRFRGWSALHLVLQICIAASAVSATKLVGLTFDAHVDDAEILRLTVPLVVFFVALAGLHACTRRRPAAPLAWLSLVVAVIIGVVGVLAWYVSWIHLAETLPLLDLVAIGYLIAASQVRTRTRVIDLESFVLA